MSPVFTLRARRVAACVILGTMLTLTGCAGPSAPADPHDGMTRLDLDSVLGKVPTKDDTARGIGTGVSEQLDVRPDALADAADLAAQEVAVTSSATVAAIAPAPVQAPVAEQAPAPVETPVEAQPQLPEEQVGGARCPEPGQVVVALLEDGSGVCALPDADTLPAQ